MTTRDASAPAGLLVALALAVSACGGASAATRVDGVPTTSGTLAAASDGPVVTVPAPPDTVPPDTVQPDPGPPDTGPATTSPSPTLPPTEGLSATTSPAPIPVVGPAPVAVRSAVIGLDSEVQHVGLQVDDGGVEVPDFPVAGWYRFGARPGQPGPTVIVGHVDSRDGPAVFFRLRDLAPGDTVDVVVADGSIARYEVVGTQQFPKAEFPTFEVFGATASDTLRLVTCTGEFDREIRSYDDNLVVTARRIG